MEEHCKLDDPCSSVSVGLPWPVYNAHFKIIKTLHDCDSYTTFEVSCNNCTTNKTRTADSRSMSNLRKHLKVGMIIIIFLDTYNI